MTIVYHSQIRLFFLKDELIAVYHKCNELRKWSTTFVRMYKVKCLIALIHKYIRMVFAEQYLSSGYESLRQDTWQVIEDRFCSHNSLDIGEGY